MSELNIYIIRHAESEHNANTMHMIGGRMDDSMLTITGEIQAKMLGNRLKSENKTFDSVYASTATRARETAREVSKLIGYPLEKIILRDDLLEFDHGDFNGRLRTDVYTPEFKKYLDEHSWEFTPPNGESQKMVAERMYTALIDVVSKEKDHITNNVEKNIAIFTHGTATRAVLCKIMGFHPKYIFRTEIDNTSITELKYDGKDFIVKRINDHAHLKS
jgi:broad specificity phosphatase PhoE